MTVLWIVGGVAVWLLVAAVVGVAVGRVIRRRDRQVPRDDARTGEPGRRRHERTRT